MSLEQLTEKGMADGVHDKRLQTLDADGIAVNERELATPSTSRHYLPTTGLHFKRWRKTNHRNGGCGYQCQRWYTRFQDTGDWVTKPDP